MPKMIACAAAKSSRTQPDSRASGNEPLPYAIRAPSGDQQTLHGRPSAGDGS